MAFEAVKIGTRVNLVDHIEVSYTIYDADPETANLLRESAKNFLLEFRLLVTVTEVQLQARDARVGGEERGADAIQTDG